MSNVNLSLASNDGSFRNQRNEKSEIRVMQSTTGLGKMSEEITRPELDAKLELVEARMDARLARMESVVERMGKDIDSITKATGNFKFWAIGTALAIVVGLYSANVSLLQGFVAAFESGRSIGTTTGAQGHSAPPPPPATSSKQKG